MSDTFGAVNLNILQLPMNLRGGSKTEIIEIPGGDTRYVDLAGRAAQSFVVTLYFESFSDYQTLDALRGTQDTLSCVLGSFTAVLLDLAFVPNSWQPGNLLDAQATFLLV